MKDRGIMFNAFGQDHIDEAFTAAERIRDVWPEIDVTIQQHHRDPRADVPVQMYRMAGMGKTPYERTISMDTDTYLVEPVPELFDVLDEFDCALPMANIRQLYPLDVPDCFYNFNPGVFAYKQSTQMYEFLADWKSRFIEHHAMLEGKSHPEVGWFHSQPSFTEAIYYSDLRIAPLGQEYNWQGTGYVQRPVKIVHKRPDPYREAMRINLISDKPRTALLYGKVAIWE